MSNENEPLRVNGVGRDASEPRTLIVYLSRPYSDDEMREIHDRALDWNAKAASGGDAVGGQCSCLGRGDWCSRCGGSGQEPPEATATDRADAAIQRLAGYSAGLRNRIARELGVTYDNEIVSAIKKLTAQATRPAREETTAEKREEGAGVKVTEEMVDAAHDAYQDHMTGPDDRLRDLLRAAIRAALRASAKPIPDSQKCGPGEGIDCDNIEDDGL